MSRRDAYLAVWGTAYLVLAGSAAIGDVSPLWPLWAGTFGLAGVLCVAAAASPWPLFQTAAFTGLAAAPAARATWHTINLVADRMSVDDLLGVALWSVVGVGHYIVAGWPILLPPSHDIHGDGDGAGGADE